MCDARNLSHMNSHKKEDSRMKESKAPSLGRTPAQKFFDKWQGLFYLIPWIIGFVVFKAIRCTCERY